MKPKSLKKPLKKSIKPIIRVIGWVTIYLTFVQYAWTFMLAYFSGEYAVAVHINDFGEAHIEFLWLVIGVPCALYLFIEKLWSTEFYKKLREKR